jgi:hypothetical protein
VADHPHLHRVGRRRRVLDRDQAAGGDQEEDEDDQRRHHRPGELDLVAAVDLRRLAPVVAGPGAEADDAVRQQPADDDEDRRADAEHQQRQRVDLVRRGRQWPEDAGDRPRRRAGAGRYEQAGEQPERAAPLTLSYPAPRHASR